MPKKLYGRHTAKQHRKNLGCALGAIALPFLLFSTDRQSFTGKGIIQIFLAVAVVAFLMAFGDIPLANRIYCLLFSAGSAATAYGVYQRRAKQKELGQNSIEQLSETEDEEE